MSATMITHQDLIESCKKGDQKAQMEIYKLYYKAMYNISLQIVGDAMEAEDIMQESFLKAFRLLPGTDLEKGFGGWLRKIVINKSLDAVRKRKIYFEDVEMLKDDKIDEASLEEEGESISEKISRVKAALGRLPEKYKVVLSLNLFEGCDHEEIETSFGSFEADALGNSVNSITASHGDVRIGRIAKGKIDTNFGSIHIQDAGSLEIEMNQGNITIGTAGNLSAEVNMGSLKVERVGPAFEEISIEMNMGNIELGIDKDAGFTIEAEMKMGNIDLPKELGKPSEGQNAMKSSFEGKYGNGKSSISLEGNFGSIEIKLK